MGIVKLGSSKKILGKAGNLNKLYNDFNIAQGFVIPSSMIDEVLVFNKISLKDEDDVIREKIMNCIIPFEDEVLSYVDKMGVKKFIVRSSASVEDGCDYSFAGQFDSILDVDKYTLIDAIRKCLLSRFSSSVKSYMNKNNIEDSFSFDILVQEMIVSNIAGIAFSLNPSNGCDEVLIEASKCQCSEIVSGNVRPNMYNSSNLKEDELLTIDMLHVAIDNVKKLKKIFNKDIEIEFCFKDNKFYLFQVRPITKVYNTLSNYIKSEVWCSFKNNNWNLFNRSLWIMGATKYKNVNVKNEVTEDITVYYPDNLKQVRGFNGNQPPLSDEVISAHNCSDVNKYIDEYEQVSNKIKSISVDISDDIINDDFKNFNLNLKKIIKENAILNSYEYLIGSLASALYDKLDNYTVNRVSSWRNSQDNSYFGVYESIFKYVYEHFNIISDFHSFRMFVHVSEVLNLCSAKLSSTTLDKRIKKREKYGFVLLNLRDKKYTNKVIMDKNIIDVVKSRFMELENGVGVDSLDGIKGHSTLKNGKVIKGECVVIKDNNTDLSEYDLNLKILVCDVTTAKDVQYIKNLKALIVNSGGILCHSAIFSREFNIPCLMGCENATTYFNTGDEIYYDVDKEIAWK